MQATSGADLLSDGPIFGGLDLAIATHHLIAYRLCADLIGRADGPSLHLALVVTAIARVFVAVITPFGAEDALGEVGAQDPVAARRLGTGVGAGVVIDAVAVVTFLTCAQASITAACLAFRIRR